MIPTLTLPFLLLVAIVTTGKVDLSKYFHAPDIALTQRYNLIYQLHGLNDTKVAALIGVDNSTMSRYRRGIWNPDVDMKIKIARVLKIDTAILYGDTLIFEKWKNSQSPESHSADTKEESQPLGDTAEVLHSKKLESDQDAV